MTSYEWLLALHLLAAFASVAGVVLYVALLVGAAPGGDRPQGMPLGRISRVAALLWNVGGIAVLVFGVWLALDVDGYEITDGWILGAVVLWIVATGAGGPVAAGWRRAVDGGDAAEAAPMRTTRMVALHAVMAVALAALLVVMVYKPGV